MKPKMMEERIPHGDVGHFCHEGCAGYAKGGEVEPMPAARARNLEELGLPGDMDTGASRAADFIPGIGLLKRITQDEMINRRMANPELLHNTAGKGLETNFQRNAPFDKSAHEADVQLMADGGVAGLDGVMSNPNPEMTMPTEEIAGTSKDPSEISDEVREFIEQSHKNTRESRPDEGWHIAPAPHQDSVAPYKKDEAEEAPDVLNQLRGFAGGGSVPGYDDGGQAPDPNAILQELAPPGSGMIAPAPAPENVPQKPAPLQNMAPPTETTPPAVNVPRNLAPALNDQDFMDRANKMLGLNPNEQAGFMKMLGGNAQKAQLGSALAGIGDAIASGGTLGKVNPGALNKSEELINGRTAEGMEGLKSIRDNQGKAMEVADKLEARDPASPLSKWAQKAYGPVGKKIGLNLDNASATLIGDVTGKGVDALNTEYQNQLKMMGLDLQKKQVEATIGNQKAERDIAREGHQAEAAKTLADRGIFKTLANAIPGTAGHTATKVLEKQAEGVAPDVAAYAQKHGITVEQAQAIKDQRTGGK